MLFMNIRSLSVVSLVLLVGCATPVYVPTLHYIIAPPADVQEADTTDRCLAIRTLESTQTYKLQVLYRTNNVVLDEYPNSKWAELPKEAVTQAITDAIIASKRFRDVANAADFPVPDLLLTGKLRHFEEVRNEEGRFAECEVRLELRTTKERELLWAETLNESVPVSEKTVEGTAKAMNQAVAQIATKVAKVLSSI